jgi:hypothetical protein
MIRHRARRAFLLVAVVSLVAGCTTSVDGSAVKTAGGPPAGTVDVALLDPGNYSTKPVAPMGVAGNPGKGSLLDAQRMADFVIGPWEVDPTLVTKNPFGFSGGAMPLQSDALEVVMVPDAAQAGYRHQFLNGYASYREAKGQKKLFNVLLRMADPESASAAAREMAKATLDKPVELVPPVTKSAMPIPGHPEANAVSQSFFDSAEERVNWNVVDSFAAHGPYVLMQRASVTSPSLNPPDVAAGLAAAAGLVAKTIDLQGPRIDGFTPTDPAQFVNLPRDPSGLLAKALPVPKGSANVNNNATWGAHAMLHYQDEPLVSAKVFGDAGVDVAVVGVGWVYQARDPAGAGIVADDANRLLASGGATPVDPVPNLPDSRCFKYSDGGFVCVATAGRYEFEESDFQLNDVYQRTAAQYTLLAAK